MKNHKFKVNRGMTLIELLVSLSILATIGITLTSMFVNINNIQVKSTVKEEIQEELRSLMELIVQDLRNNAIDFRGYYIMNGPHASLGEHSYTDSNLSYIGFPIAFPTGGDILNPAPNFLDMDKSEDILLLLSFDGKGRTKYRRGDPDGAGDLPNALMMSKQVYSRTGTCNSMPEIDLPTGYMGSHDWNPLFPDPDFCWVLEPEYNDSAEPLYGYLPISNPAVSIADLEFFFHVHKSPFKVYEEDAVQLQPMVTIKLTGTYANSSVIMAGNVPELTIQTTVTSRNYEEPEWSTI
jgi:prepilin-type N-terminal cleavage/methylation domain-containing protein